MIELVALRCLLAASMSASGGIFLAHDVVALELNVGAPNRMQVCCTSRDRGRDHPFWKGATPPRHLWAQQNISDRSEITTLRRRPSQNQDYRNV